jgi:hypothetical protein
MIQTTHKQYQMHTLFFSITEGIASHSQALGLKLKVTVRRFEKSRVFGVLIMPSNAEKGKTLLNMHTNPISVGAAVGMFCTPAETSISLLSIPDP